MNTQTIGAIILEARHRARLTQDELAERLAVTRQAVSNWERDLKIPDPSIWLTLCTVLGLSANALAAAADRRAPVAVVTQDVTDMILSAFDVVLLRGADLGDHEEIIRRVAHLAPAMTMVLAYSEVPGRIVLGLDVDAELSDLLRGMRRRMPLIAEGLEGEVPYLIEFAVMPTLTQDALDKDLRLQRQLDLLCVVNAICELAARAFEGVASPVDLLEYVVDRGCEDDLSMTMAMTAKWLRPVTIVLPGRPQCDAHSLPAYARCAVG